MKQTKKRSLAEWQAEFPEKFTHHSLDKDLQHFQLWNDVMLTAQLPRMDAITGIKEGRYYVISDQAVGTIQSLLS